MAKSMTRRAADTGGVWLLMVAMALIWGCGETVQSTPPTSAATTPDSAQAPRDSYQRASFVLCPALESHRAELASIVGFEHNPDRALRGIGAECIIRGRDFGWLKISLPPAVIRSIPMYVRGYDTEVSPVPELGDGAAFVDASLQPHVVFQMGGLIIDVGAESVETPGRESMIELALRVREILRKANP